MHYKDESKPDDSEIIKVVAGDVIHIDHESYYTLTSPNIARSKNKIIQIAYLIDTDSTHFPQAFCAAYIPSHIHPEDFVIKK